MIARIIVIAVCAWMTGLVYGQEPRPTHFVARLNASDHVLEHVPASRADTSLVGPAGAGERIVTIPWHPLPASLAPERVTSHPIPVWRFNGTTIEPRPAAELVAAFVVRLRVHAARQLADASARLDGAQRELDAALAAEPGNTTWHAVLTASRDTIAGEVARWKGQTKP